jgi:hypothetical protein
MVSKMTGGVRWIDFEHSRAGEDSAPQFNWWIEIEQSIALELWGPDGEVWEEKCVLYNYISYY